MMTIQTLLVLFLRSLCLGVISRFCTVQLRKWQPATQIPFNLDTFIDETRIMLAARNLPTELTGGPNVTFKKYENGA